MRNTPTLSSNLRLYYLLWMIPAILLGIWSCKTEEKTADSALPFDPKQPVVVSDFQPKTGGAGQRLIIYGKNFGNDPSIISVIIGGQPAIVISAEGESIYCLVPTQAYDGDIEVRIGEEQLPIVGKANEKFIYQRKMIVSTVIGYRNERGDEPWRDGKFKDPDQNKMASGFWEPSHMKFDPKNPKHLYVTFDNNNGLYLLNFEDSVVTKVRSNFNRPRSVDFTAEGDHMIISEDRGGENDGATTLLSRARNFLDTEILTRYRQCNGATVHPINGEMYFNSYEKGQFFRFDMNTYFSQGLGQKDYETLFLVHDPQWEFKTFVHPTGNYAYIVVINQHYILRIDYNWEKKQFNQPYLVCGQLRAAGYNDGIGASVRLNQPYQGVFVKNEEYAAAGKSDEYDFYFTDQMNHAIRKLTPETIVSTFAGRGSSSLNANPWGYVDGDLRLEARFDRPTGIAYNEAEKAFYIGDRANRRFRKIALEGDN